MRPIVKFLKNELIRQIVSEATHILCTLGVEIQNKDVLSLLSDHGARVDTDRKHVTFTEKIIKKALKTAPGSFKLYDVKGKETHDFSGYNIYFTPGSAAINFLDYHTRQNRKPKPVII